MKCGGDGSLPRQAAGAYRLFDRHDVRITRDEVTEVDFTKFYVRKRVYGYPADTNAVKFLKSAA